MKPPFITVHAGIDPETVTYIGLGTIDMVRCTNV